MLAGAKHDARYPAGGIPTPVRGDKGLNSIGTDAPHLEYRDHIIQGDVLTVLPGLPPGCVDLVFGSPPYEDARTYGIDFGLKGQGWVDWMVQAVKASLRVCKGLVAFVVEGKTRKFRYSATPILLMADLHRAGVHLRKPPAFHRVGIPGSGGPDWLRNDYEFIVCCTNGGRLPWSDNKAMGHPPKWAPGGDMSYRLSDGTRRNQWGGHLAGTKERGKDGHLKKTPPRPSHVVLTKGDNKKALPGVVKKFPAAKRERTKRRADREMEEQHYVPPAKANPGNVISLKVGGGLMGSKLAHENEAPFPEKLADFFIRAFCPPDGIVLDPFSGSGTTCAVAKMTGRHFIGIDIRQSQVDLTNRRLLEGRG